MSIQSTTSRNNYIGNGAANVYPYGFRIFQNSDLLVTVRDTEGNETTLAIDDDYTVSGAGLVGGGDVTLVDNGQAWLTSGFLTDDYTLTIRRVRPLTQTTDLRNQGAYFPETVEDTFDKNVMLIQQLKDEIDRSMKLPETIDPADFDATLPATLLDNPGSALGINEDGTAFVPVLIADSIAIPVPVSQGGTGSTTALNNNRVMVSSASKIQEAAAITASRAIVSDSNGLPVASATTATEIGRVAGVTSAIQTQLNALSAAITAAILSATANAGFKKAEQVNVSVTTFDISNNTTTANQTSVRFRDGEVRTVTEDTSLTSKYRRCIITETAEFTSGTENSGIRSGLSEATNTWYAVYAVKSLIDATKFVLVMDTTYPDLANISTLNSRYGTNGWEYMFSRRNGDASGATGDLLSVIQNGRMFTFNNAISTGVATPGLLLASSSGSTTLTWSYAAGTGASEIPAGFKVCDITHYRTSVSGTDQRCQLSDSAASVNYAYLNSSVSQAALNKTSNIPIEGGLKATLSGGGSADHVLTLAGYIDGYL